MIEHWRNVSRPSPYFAIIGFAVWYILFLLVLSTVTILLS